MVEQTCENCGKIASLSDNGWVLCEACISHFEAEITRNQAAKDAGLVRWNTSQHDPYWRMWLGSRELFDTILHMAPSKGTHIHRVLGGDIYECGRNDHCTVQVWLTHCEVVVAYPAYAEVGRLDVAGLKEFETWIRELHSEPLNLALHAVDRATVRCAK